MAQTYVVRYGRMRFLGEYRGVPDQEHVRGQHVMVRSDRGTELGEVLCPFTEQTARFMPNPTQGEILRLATTEDQEQEARLLAGSEAGLRHLPGADRQAPAADEPGRRGDDPRPRAGGVLLSGREARRFPRAGERPGPRAANAHRDAPDRCPRRGEAAGRLRRLRQTGLLQHTPDAHAARLDEDGQDPKDDPRPGQDLGPVRALEVLPALRVRHLSHDGKNTAAGWIQGCHAQGARAHCRARIFWFRSWSSSSRITGGSSSAATTS